MDRPEPYVIYYEDKFKVQAYQDTHGTEEPLDPGDFDSQVQAENLAEARMTARSLLAFGHGTPRIYARVGIVEELVDGLTCYDWEEEPIEDA